MATRTKQSTTYKQEFDLGGDVIVKVGLTLPFALPEGRVTALLTELVDGIEEARADSAPRQARLFSREPALAGAAGASSNGRGD